MSGGSLDYFYSDLESHVGDFEDKELDALVEDLAKLFHDREWYLSADTGIGSWNAARDAFKAKWFTPLGREERIETYLREFTEEVRRSFGISKRYCENCDRWTPGKDSSDYGKCSRTRSCLYHRMEFCDDWEERKT